MPSVEKARVSRGFTLLEILVVVAIIGMMAAVVVVNVAPKGGEARAKLVRSDIAGIEAAVEMYLLDHGRFPLALTDLEPKHIKRLSNDPWGNAYQLRRPGQHSDFDVFSFGADGQPGGEELDADIGNWHLR